MKKLFSYRYSWLLTQLMAVCLIAATCNNADAQSWNAADTGALPVHYTNEVSSAKTSFRLFPDPNNGAFTVHISSSQKEQVTVFITNVLGDQVKKFKANTNVDVDVEMDDVAGAYFISAVTKEGVKTMKMSVE